MCSEGKDKSFSQKKRMCIFAPISSSFQGKRKRFITNFVSKIIRMHTRRYLSLAFTRISTEKTQFFLAQRHRI